MVTESWTITFIAKNQRVLADLRKRQPLVGCLYQRERVAVVFLADCAPPGMDSVGFIQSTRPDNAPQRQLVVYRDGGEWKAQGLAVPAGNPVISTTLKDVVARTPYKPIHQRLLTHIKVMFVGLGSIGSAVRDMLVRGGIGGLVLCDIDHVEIHNVYRHAANLLSVGRLKVDSEAEDSQRINPSIKIKTCHDDITTWSPEKRAALVKDVDLIIESTDKQSVKRSIMELGYRCHKPVLYVGAFDNADGGEIYYWLPERQMACYSCLPRRDDAPRNHRLDYTTATGPEDYAGEPGLGASVRLYAAAGAQVALAILLRKTDSKAGQFIQDNRYQYLLMGSATSQGFYMFEYPFQNLFRQILGINPTCSLHHPDAYLEQLRLNAGQQA